MRITLTNKGANGNKILFFNIVVPISFNSLFVSHATGNNGPWNATIFGNFIHMDSNGGAQDLDLGDFATVTFTATAVSNPGSITWNTAAWHNRTIGTNRGCRQRRRNR
jgi:ABC-type anion transport system duplicated permease subunit